MNEPSVMRRSKPTVGTALLVIGGVLFIIGAFVRAATVKLPTGSASESLWDQDWEGIASLALGILLLLAATWAFLARGTLRGAGLAILVAGLAGTGLALYKILTVESEAVDGVAASLAQQQGIPVESAKPVAQQLFDSGQASVSVDIGLYLVLIAGAVTIVGSILLALSPSGQRNPSTAASVV